MAAVLALVLVVIGYQYIRIQNLKSEVKEERALKITHKMNAESCRNKVKRQNKAFEAISADYSQKMSKLEKLKNKPPKVRYKTIYKTAPAMREEDSNECKDIKRLLDDIRSAGF